MFLTFGKDLIESIHSYTSFDNQIYLISNDNILTEHNLLSSQRYFGDFESMNESENQFIYFAVMIKFLQLFSLHKTLLTKVKNVEGVVEICQSMRTFQVMINHDNHIWYNIAFHQGFGYNLLSSESILIKIIYNCCSDI